MVSCITALVVVCAGAGAALQESSVSLAGIIDFHAHAGPDSRPRSVNDLEAAQLFKQAGLRGMVLKNHFTMTADRAALAMAQVEGLEIFGGVALNRAVGGINPEAVRQLVAFSGGRGKVVWLPTFDSEFWITRDGTGEPFVPVMENGKPVPGLVEVFELVAEHDLVLAMGHSAPEEVLLLIPVAREVGVRNILVTHVFGQDATLDQMRKMAAANVIMELDWLAVYSGGLSIQDYTRVIQELGAERFLISSDLGQEGNPTHPEGLRSYISALREAGITDEQIDIMARRNPRASARSRVGARSSALRHDLRYQRPVHVGQTHVPAVVLTGQLCVVHSE